MAFADFLTEGAKIPEGSALTAMNKQTVLPEWYTNYAMNVLSGQQALSSVPYTAYQGPRVAGFTPDQNTAFDMTKAAAGSFAPGMNAAMDATKGALGSSSMGAAQPYFDRATTMDAVGAAQPYYQGALGSIGQSTKTSALGQAMPYINMSAQSATNVSPYMNPYIDLVVNRIGDLGARTLREQLLPEIEGRYIGAGQWGGSGQMTDTARALRDVNESVLAQQGQLLNTGYNTAQGALQADLQRYGQLGSTVGQLGSTDQSNWLRAGEAQANIGSQMGQLTAQQQQLLANLGQMSGNLTSTDTSNTLAAAGQLGNLAALQQKYALEGANAVGNIGQQQQTLNQQNLDIAYGDFLRQQGYPQEQINAMLNTFKNVGQGVPQASQEVGLQPVGSNAEYKPSTAATVIGSLGSLAAIGKNLGWF